MSSQIWRADTYTPSSPTTRPAGISIGANSAADVLDGEALTQQPLDQLGPFFACHPVETVEQARRLDAVNTDVVGHRLNVYLVL